MSVMNLLLEVRTMRSLFFPLVVLCLVLAADSGNLAAARPPARNFVTGRMTGAQEVPPVDAVAQGTAVFNLNPAGTELRFRVVVSRIMNVFAAHIHRAPVGVNGPVVVGLFSGPPAGGPVSGVLSRGTIVRGVTPLPPSLGLLLNNAQRFDVLVALMRSGNTYVNVHTLPGVPSGQIRGQLRPRP
jgi:hypothetical protein